MKILPFALNALIAAVCTILVIAVIALRVPQKATAPEQVPTISHTIEIRPTGFFPVDAVVPPDSSVCWVNTDTLAHYPESGPSVSPFGFHPDDPIQPGAVWCFPFTSIGTWSYGERGEDGFQGTITVKESR
ncbi:MAG: hypothetical protein AAB728_03365 [Patescibacteria group bacterium]